MLSWLRNIVGLILLVIIIILIRIYVVTPIAVEGESMMPTLLDGEKAVLYKLDTIKRFDIIPLVAPDDPSLNYVKRVIGMPGDTVEYKDDCLYINGIATDEDYLDDYKNKWNNAGNTEPMTPDFTLEELTGQQTVPADSYFVLGDNRQVSKDSRFPEVGFIPKENILGKVKLIVWPISEFEVLS